MKRSVALPELLAPAGNEEAFWAAVAAGADAVYLGVSEGSSNARILAENFTRDQLSRLIPLAHGYGVRVYIALNTLTYDRELEGALDLARFLSDAGADALIVADLGLAARLRRELPENAPTRLDPSLYPQPPRCGRFSRTRLFPRRLGKRDG